MRSSEIVSNACFGGSCCIILIDALRYCTVGISYGGPEWPNPQSHGLDRSQTSQSRYPRFSALSETEDDRNGIPALLLLFCLAIGELLKEKAMKATLG